MSEVMLLRADGGSRIGFGHVMRCLALAQTWQRRGGIAIFAMAESDPALEDKLKILGIERVPLDVVPGSVNDAERTTRLALDRRASWVAADGYAFKAEWQRSLKDAGLRLLLFDDYGHADFYAADFILNQNLHATAAMYPRCEPWTKVMLGARYAQLRDEFLEWRDWKRKIAPLVTRVLVTMGGSDSDNVTGAVVQALSSFPHIKAVVVAGGCNPNIKELRSDVAALSNLELKIDPPNIPQLIAWADVAVSAGGSTVWELAFLGLPGIIVPIAANQDAATDAWRRSGLAVVVPRTSAKRSETIACSLKALCSASPEKRAAISAALRLLVDGRGPERVVRLLQASKVTLRPVVEDDCALLWRWANDPDVRTWSFRSEQIAWDEHLMWFRSKRGSPGWHIACNAQSRPVGQVRLEMDSARTGIVNFSVAPEHRGCGLGVSILAAMLDDVFRTTSTNVIVAFVKPANLASICCFKRAGFQEQATCELNGDKVLQFAFHRDEY